MGIIGPLIFIVAIMGAAYVIGRKKAPETTDKVVAAGLALLAAVGAWIGGLFDKLVN